MVHIDRVSCALLGAGLFHAVHLLLNLPAYNAAWGWTMEVPSSADFTCEEGTKIGCPDATHGTSKMGVNITDPTKCEAGEATPCCLDSAFTCTVKAKAGKSCDVTSTMIRCAKTAAPDTKAQPDKMMCINLGAGDAMPKDSDLSWSTVPTCSATTAAPATTTAGSTSVDSADTLSAGILVWATLLVLHC